MRASPSDGLRFDGDSAAKRVWLNAADLCAWEFTSAGLRRPTLGELERWAPTVGAMRRLQTLARAIGLGGHGVAVMKLAERAAGGEGARAGLLSAVELVGARAMGGWLGSGALTVAPEGKGKAPDPAVAAEAAAKSWWSAR